MRLKKYVWSLCAAAIVSSTACSKMDDQPFDTFDPSKAFRNLEDVNAGINGAYEVMDYDLIANSAVVSDEVMLPNENRVSNTGLFRWQYTSSSETVTAPYGIYYKAIDRANRVLMALEAVPELGKENPKLRDHYHGELLTLRAYAHLELVRAFASGYTFESMGVPYMLKSEVSSPSRLTVAQNLELVMTDLNEAINLIDEDVKDPARLTKLAALAILARTALYAEDWDRAVRFSEMLITAVPLTGRADYASLWTDEIDGEVIWKLKRVNPDESRLGAAFFRESGSVVLYAPSLKLLQTFDVANDIRYAAYITHDNDRGAGKSAYLIKKYVGDPEKAPGLVDLKLLRASEFYLIRAEAYAEQGNLSAAAKDLNALRRARIRNYTDVTFANKESLLSAVLEERFKELAFEGHRFFDLKRHGLPVERLAADAVNSAGQRVLPTTKAQYNFPIPVNEMLANDNMIQNPNY